MKIKQKVKSSKEVHITLTEREAEGLATILFFAERGSKNYLLAELEDLGIWYDLSRIETDSDGQQIVDLSK